ncbi:MAG TPA: hypothetical protein VJH22_02660 [Candidatus Nanoarchaeia archaeon]|nr:hypothetical protein [Candidatus Nanoarchaeia archaeon]
MMNLSNDFLKLTKNASIALKKNYVLTPIPGDPGVHPFFREKKLNGLRMLFLIYEELKSIYLINITDKKHQQADIEMIKDNLDRFKEEIIHLTR